MVFPTSMLAESEETLVLAQQQHRAIVDAIRNREGTRAEHLAREHARIGWMVLQRALSDQDVLNRVPGGPLIDLENQ
jgi:GntR family transcriptional regulator of vanillate catabolism